MRSNWRPCGRDASSWTRQLTIVPRGRLFWEEATSHAAIPATPRLRLGADGDGVPAVGPERARNLFGHYQHQVSWLREQTGALAGGWHCGDAAALLHRLPRTDRCDSLGLRVLPRVAAGGAGRRAKGFGSAAMDSRGRHSFSALGMGEADPDHCGSALLHR